jgi:hypothetical protein
MLTDIPDKDLRQSLQRGAEFILRAQRPDGRIHWTCNGKLDPWDHIEAAMGLAVAGHTQAATAAYQWLVTQQAVDGSWSAEYHQTPDGLVAGAHKETHFIAYIATGVWHQYQVTGDKNQLAEFWPCVEAALDCVLRYQTDEGDIAWALDAHNQPADDALLTACSSILRSLESGLRMAICLQQHKPQWQLAWRALARAITTKPQRFDRNWPSKARFAMDWYYPLLSGAYPASAAQVRLAARWDEFVVQDLGCRCVNDEPWVTLAETCELIMAMVLAHEQERALPMLKCLQRWQDEDGGYWTGYVYRDKSIWPEEKTTWTAGAMLLAADALFRLTPAAGLFTCTQASAWATDPLDTPQTRFEEGFFSSTKVSR